jgi:hypothetical protein
MSTSPTPKASQNYYGGIFQYLTQLSGTPQQVQQAQAKLAQATPTTAAVYQAMNLLPEGELKSWLTANPVQFWKKIIQLFTGRKFTSGEYIAAERYNDQILCNGNVSRAQISDEMVPVAWQVLTTLFGVLIRTSEDLDALDHGVDAYYARPFKKWQPLEAVQRAVFLKQNFYPISTYNTSCWDLKYFEKYPLVAPIPDASIDNGSPAYYSGDLPGGAKAVNGVIPADAQAILKQYIGATIDEQTGEITTPGQKQLNDIMRNPITVILGVVVFVMLVILIKKRFA